MSIELSYIKVGDYYLRNLILNRSGLYCKPVLPSEEDLRVKRLIDEIYTAHPEFGYRRIGVWLNKERA